MVVYPRVIYMTAKAATKAKNKYNAVNYDSLRIVVPKGRKDRIQSAADAAGESLNKFVNTAIEDRIERLQAPHEPGNKKGKQNSP